MKRPEGEWQERCWTLCVDVGACHMLESVLLLLLLFVVTETWVGGGSVRDDGREKDCKFAKDRRSCLGSELLGLL